MASIAQVRTQLLPHALAPDPDRANLRLAARAAVTYSLVFAVAWLVLGSADATLFAAFAVFGLLLLANFGGPIRNRLAAFVLTTLVGATLVVVGSLASPSFWTATLVTLVVVFGIEFAGVFGGYVAWNSGATPDGGRPGGISPGSRERNPRTHHRLVAGRLCVGRGRGAVVAAPRA